MNKISGKLHWWYYLLVFVIFVLALLIVRWKTASNIRTYLPGATQHFSMTPYDGISDFEQNYTLSLLEQHFIPLHAKYSCNYRISRPYKVNLYGTNESLQKHIIKREWVGADCECISGNPTINLVSEPETDTVVHELTHAILCELAGASQTDSYPRWFHEGLSEYEAAKFEYEPDIFRHLSLWIHKDMIMPYKQFIAFNPGVEENRTKRDFYYGTCLQLILYIEHNFGNNALQTIVCQVADGNEFDAVLLAVTGMPPAEMYEEWINQFF